MWAVNHTKTLIISRELDNNKKSHEVKSSVVYLTRTKKAAKQLIADRISDLEKHYGSELGNNTILIKYEPKAKDTTKLAYAKAAGDMYSEEFRISKSARGVESISDYLNDLPD